MKYLICADIHGSIEAAEKIIQNFKTLKCDYLIILGDIINHGPRNGIPEKYDPPAVADLLNKYADKIMACRGNCDSEVTQMLMEFRCMQDYIFLADNGIRIFCTHGHLDQLNPSVKDEFKMPHCDIFFSGHTHVQVLEKHNNNQIICNPGSTTLPKLSSSKGFAVYEHKNISLYDLNGTILKTMDL